MVRMEIEYASPLVLGRRISTEQAFSVIAAGCLRQIEANAQGVILISDPEYLHQMRVGLRRLRSALKLFRGVLHLPPDLAAELDWLSAHLAPARDLDVLVHRTFPTALYALRGVSGGHALARLLQEKAAQARILASEAVGSVRYSSLMLSLSQWLHGGEWRHAMAPAELACLGMPVAVFARKILRRASKRLAKRAPALKIGNAAEQHGVRIAAKQLRYAVEFFSSLCRRKRFRPYMKSLSALLDELGGANDAVVAQTLLDEHGNGDTRVWRAAAEVNAWLASRVAGRDRKRRKAFRNFAVLRLPLR